MHVYGFHPVREALRRRPEAVRRVLELQGVSPQQISTVSYGEEKPAVEGHSDTAWRMNRRVEIVYSAY